MLSFCLGEIHGKNQSRAMLLFLYLKLRWRNTGERKNNERKSYQSNFYSNLCTNQLHPWRTDRASPPDGSLQCP